MEKNATQVEQAAEATDIVEAARTDAEQMSRGSLSMAWWGCSSALFSVYVGAAMAVAYGTVQALIGLTLTIVTYSVINAILCKYAINNRTTVALFSRTVLGTAGSCIATMIFALVAIYYAVFEGSIVAYAFRAAFGGEMWVWSLVVVAYSTPLVFGGARRFLDKLNGALLPLYIFGLIAAVVWASVVHGFAGDRIFTPVDAVPISSGGPGWLAVYAGYMGIWVLMMFTMDYAAMGRRTDVRFHQHFTFGWLFYIGSIGFSGVIGALLTFTIPGLQVSETGVAGGIVSLMGIVGLVVIVATQTRINTANYYLGAANLRAFGERVLRIKMPHVIWVLVASTIIFLMMLLPIVEYLLVALAWQGVLVTAWVAIAVTHILMDRGMNQEPGELPDHAYASYNVAGLAAWAAGTFTGVVMLEGVTLLDPSLAGVGSTWGPILTALVAAGTYALLWRRRGPSTALLAGQRVEAVVPATGPR